jgi:hypothetical protein
VVESAMIEFMGAGAYFAHESVIIDSGCMIGAGTRIWHFSHIMEGANIGLECTIGQNVVVAPQVILGNRCKVQNNVSLYTGLVCGDEVFFGPSCVFTNVWNPRAAIQRRHEFRQTLIGRGVTIGANATIVCGHEIGEYAFVGAGAVVTHSILPYELWVGNPARRIGWMSRAGERLSFDKEGRAACPIDGSVYRLCGEYVICESENIEHT